MSTEVPGSTPEAPAPAPVTTPEPPPAPAGTPSKDEKLWAMLSHIGGIFFAFVAPLVVWLVQKDKGMPFVEDQAKESLNFQITVAIAYIAAGILSAAIIGGLLFPVIAVANLVLCIMAGMKANEGTEYRYPFALRLVK